MAFRTNCAAVWLSVPYSGVTRTRISRNYAFARSRNSRIFIATRCLQYLITPHFQNLTGQLAHEIRIFNQENRFVTAWRLIDYSALTLVERFSRSIQSRKIDIESRSFTRPALHSDVTAALFNDAVRRWEPQARTAVFVFCGEEGFKNMWQDFGVHSATGILNREHGVRTALHIKAEALWRLIQLDIAGVDAKRAAIRHRVERVDDEVHQHLLNLSAIGLNAPHVVAEIGH